MLSDCLENTPCLIVVRLSKRREVRGTGEGIQKREQIPLGAVGGAINERSLYGKWYEGSSETETDWLGRWLRD